MGLVKIMWGQAPAFARQILGTGPRVALISAADSGDRPSRCLDFRGNFGDIPHFLFSSAGVNSTSSTRPFPSIVTWRIVG